LQIACKFTYNNQDMKLNKSLYLCLKRKTNAMQNAQMQKDKLDLIEKIIKLDDSKTLELLKDILDEDDSYELTAAQKLMVEESYAKYVSGEERGYSWDEIQENIAGIKKNLNEKRA